MEDERQRKRQRFNSPGNTEATVNNTLDNSACVVFDTSRHDATPNNCLGEAGHCVSETALIRKGVCYGMLENLPIFPTTTTTVLDNPTLVRAYLDKNGTIQRSADGAFVGKLEDRASKCLFKLGSEEDIEIQLMIKTVVPKRYQSRATRPVALASAIIYGPEDVSDDVGDFLDRCDYVLQDPFSCEHNVPYKNPHCLSTLFETPRMTFELHNPDPGHYNFTPSNALQALETIDDFPEWSQPAALKTKLHQHQKQALWFFTMREALNSIEHIWQKRTQIDGTVSYVSNITGAYQSIPPPVWNGGILADEMGLGKTLQMISLIATDRELQSQSQKTRYGPVVGPQAATLVVVPLSLISVWEYELSCHLYPSTISWKRHHGKSRLGGGTGSSCPNVVLTTYQTVQAEYKRREEHSTNGSCLFGHRWRRIILDEAHEIRNRTVTWSAVSALEAVSRWAVTGTPIQNSFADVSGLLGFLRFRPYDDAKSFDKDIIEPFRRGNVEEGARRLKALCRPIMIRRPKSVIALPPRRDLTKVVEFSPEERREYSRIENLWQEFSGETAIPSSLGAIQLLNMLRLFCNLGACSTETTSSVSRQTDMIIPERDVPVETAITTEVALGGASCEGCFQIIDNPDILNAQGPSPCAYYSECCKAYCSNCASLNTYQTAMQFPCCERSPCVLRPLPPKLVRKVRNDELPPDTYTAQTSKIRALIQEVVDCIPEKSVIFSFWTSSLTVIQRALVAAGIRCVRIDGSVSLPDRGRAIRDFKEDESIKAILVTISCGGVGLDLTAGSRVHLLEPQWNPAVEDQALARVHRMGQYRPVTTIRYVMKDSIEEFVASVKDKKQLLARLLPQNTHVQNPEGEQS